VTLMLVLSLFSSLRELKRWDAATFAGSEPPS
jgi:hypothetical protein